MNKKIAIRQKVQKWYQDCFVDYNEEEFISFFDRVIEKCDEGYSLNNAFYYCQWEELGKEFFEK